MDGQNKHTWREYYRSQYEALRAAPPGSPICTPCTSFDDFLKIKYRTFSDLLSPAEWEAYLDDPRRMSRSEVMRG